MNRKLLDLRFLIGAFFLLIGIILALYGLAVNPPSDLDWNVDLWWGVFMIVFGVIFILWSRREESED